ncbi:hypothetical protein AWH56_009585 [Anaerobacillus isosaccharinicus]|uniref:Uncharacterized protein n=1 Tax=Anaerobacillus isosaccharinicus TaxID=1532552 RepID=A0A1S2MDQ7_9BACI|nr:hypothetical protein [Anaerobacillus isosaccharinicus]MBA5588813.1 hypothetical protein [Anaerobacillus isosaccharinicus]QOY37794.1 hypothetical protein AWH56_009585 [Anaerobacillus isosaccharinicus]
MFILYAALTFIILVYVIAPFLNLINMSQDFFAIWVIPSIIIGLLISINQKLSVLISKDKENTKDPILTDEEIEKELENIYDEK